MPRPPFLLHARAGAPALEPLEPRLVLSVNAFDVPQFLNTGQAGTLTDIQSADFNGDGVADFVVASGNSGAKALSVFLSRRDGYRAVDIDYANGARLIRVADIDGDGDTDITFITANSTGFRRLVNDGAGGFTQSQAGAIGDGGYGAMVDYELADINGDGLVDFIQLASSFVNYQLNNGAGLFGGDTNVEIFSAAVDVEAGDIDGDGNLDLAVLRTPDDLRVFLGNGSGSFSAQTPTTVSGSNSTAVSRLALLDDDGDGAVDRFAAAATDSGRVWTRVSTSTPGSLSVGSTESFSNLSNVSSVAVGDVDGDGAPEIVAGAVIGQVLSIIRPDGSVTMVDVHHAPNVVRLQDVDGDGRLDIVLATNRVILVLPNLGNGVFAAEHRSHDAIQTANNAEYIAWGDFNGDGLQDYMAFDDGFSGSRAIFLGTGAGGFRAVRLSDTFWHYASGHLMAAGGADLDGDGRDEPFVISRFGSSVEIQAWQLVGDGYGSDPQGVVNSGDGYGDRVSVVTGDFDPANPGDEIAIATGGIVKVLAFDYGEFGNGQTTDIATYRGGFDANDIAAADIDGDGDLDVVVAHSRGVTALTRDDTGAFNAAFEALLPNGVRALAVDQFNPDTRPDIAAFTGDGYGELVFLRNLTTEADAPVFKVLPFAAYHNVGGDFLDADSADMDGDGEPDLVVVTSRDRRIVLFGDGFLGIRDAYAHAGGDGSLSSSLPVALRLIDLDRDGDLDVLHRSTSSPSTGVAMVYAYADGTLQQGGAGLDNIQTFSRLPFAPDFGSDEDGLVADFNGDGLMDFVVGKQFNSPNVEFIVYLQTPGGDFRTGVAIATNPAASSFDRLNPLSFDVADLNGDGAADIVVLNDASDYVWTLLNNGAGTSFTRLGAYAPYNGADLFRHVVLSDINADGLPDLVLWNDNPTDAITIMVGRGDGTFRGGLRIDLVSSFQYEADRPVVADFDNDGHADILVHEVIPNTNRRIVIWLGDGVGAFTRVNAGTLTGGTAGINLGVGDINRDGRPDFAYGNEDGDLRVLLNTGTPGAPSFSLTTYDLPASVFADAVIGDVNGDGNPDILVAEFSGATLFLGDRFGAFPTHTRLALGVDSSNARRTLVDIDGDGDLDVFGLQDIPSYQSAYGFILNQSSNPRRLTNAAPYALNSPAFMPGFAAIGQEYVINYDDLVAAVGAIDSDGQPPQFRIVVAPNGTLLGKGGIINGNTLFGPGEVIRWIAPAGPGGVSLVGFRVVLSDTIVETTTPVAVRFTTNNAPTFSSIPTQRGPLGGDPFSIRYDDLAAIWDAQDLDGDTISFIVTAVLNGTVTRGNGTPITIGSSQVGPGQRLTWTPAPGTDGTVPAIRIQLFDGKNRSSNTLAVRYITATTATPATIAAPPPPEPDVRTPGWLEGEDTEFGLFADAPVALRPPVYV